MAQKATNKTKKKSTAAARKTAAATPREPIRREVGAGVCALLGLFLVISFSGTNAVLIRLFAVLCRGLLGYGYFLLPFALFYAAYVLLLHGGRPVVRRVAATLLLPVDLGALLHVLLCSETLSGGFGLFAQLYATGGDMKSGGVFAGLLGYGLKSLLTAFGATAILLLVLVLLCIYATNMTVASLIQAIRNRPRLAYTPAEDEPDTASVLVNKAVQKKAERQQKKKLSEFDLPVDDPPMLPDGTKAQREKTATVKSPLDYVEECIQKKDLPNQISMDELPTQKPAQPEPEQEQEAPETFPAFEPEPQLPPEPAHRPVTVRPKTVTVSPVSRAAIEAAAAEEAAEKIKPGEVRAVANEVAQQIEASSVETPKEYVRPPLTLLSEGSGEVADGTEEMRLNTTRLNDTLQSFNIDAHISNVIRGPSVTRYELELDRGVKLSKITGLSDDIALSLGATGVRISAIPDKISVVGIEVPNKVVRSVPIREVLSSPEFQKHKSNIAFAVGLDISSNRIVGDISRLPHMLIAGTTGSGKSVCTNSLIISLLYKSSPDDVRLIMIDPKMVELGIYNGVPHLLIPVVTDPKKAAGALQWAVTEMMRRYKMMADAGVRDLSSYNKIAVQDAERQKLPQIVVVIDELADLMLVAAKEVEESICRVAQMGRAAGMHLIIATQRPSADVITGLMKANIPSRIAFAVASQLESRIILDTTGAEKLVGKGDMLFAPLGLGKPRRVQGCFISDQEVQAVVEFIKEHFESDYSKEVIEQIEQHAAQGGSKDSGACADTGSADSEDEADELLPAAVDVILETGQASVSMLQRRLKLGYARAARIVDEMEERGIVGPFEGSKPRQLLITKEQWAQMNGRELELLPEENPPVEDELL